MSLTLDSNAIVRAVATLNAFPGLSAVSNDDAVRLIHRASALIRKITGRRLLIDDNVSQTLYLDGDGSRDLPLPEGPVTVLTSVYNDPERTFDSGEYDLDDIIIYGGYRGAAYKDDHEDFPTRLTTYGTEGFGKARQNIQVIGKFGYGDTESYYPIPEDLVLACLLLCKDFQLHSDIALKAERTQTYSYQKGGSKELMGGIPREAASIIQRYARWEVY